MLLCPTARSRRWIELTVEEQRAYVMRLLDALEVTDRDKRLKVARAILYLAQGASARYITASNRPFSQRTFCLVIVGKAVSNIIKVVLFYSGVTVSQHAIKSMSFKSIQLVNHLKSPKVNKSET